ncbi:MAG: DUF411 domain-containing protein [Patescibacteria group bacterium]
MKKILTVISIGIVALAGFMTWNVFTVKNNQEKLTRLIANPKATVVAGTSCGCCKLYGQYLKKQGFEVDFQFGSQEEIDRYKDSNGIPANLRSCHTTRIGDYFIEGHVPVEAIIKFMQEKSPHKGIALPGMPSASPGMPGPKYEPFDIHTITQDGKDGGTFVQL